MHQSLRGNVNIFQPDRNFSSIYGTLIFSTAFQSSGNQFVSANTSIQSRSHFYFLKIHLNIILSYNFVSSKLFPSLTIPHKNLYAALLSPIPVTWTAQFFLLGLVTREKNWLYIQITKLLLSFNFPDSSSFLDQTVFLSTLFSYILSLYSSLIMNNELSRSYKKKNKLIFLLF